RLLRHIDADSGLDVLQFCNPPDLFFPIARFWGARGKRVVFDQHDLAPQIIQSRYRGLLGRMLWPLARWCERQTFDASDAVMVANDSFAALARGRGVPSDRLFVLRYGPDLARFRRVAPDTSLRRRFARLVCLVGALGHEDGG